ncbi:nucleotidyltransferase domain-containing protein [Methanosphaera sp. ISO3-F5]|uniref:nucleotidyltransferase domain-containing protein n=1 Tax=Methanosphaera sp. ISO3-F5 TaxID=1452353 RepID=UPI002B2585F5|nr:nucleotidyltransferase domain-containing protein [Methanosphaera sp. ISO3-F5]WQH63391.1 nucleotidyltransferase domain-containing protein [Methanosphaera sp. ISO3-F5]
MYNRVEIAKEFAKKIKSKDIKKIILFGSVARGEDTEDSDIDILIIANNEEELEDYISEEVIDILLTQKQYISAHIMSQNHYNETKNFSFLRNVLEDGVIIG